MRNTLKLSLLPLSLTLALPLLGGCDTGSDGAADPDAGAQCAALYYPDSDGDGYGDESAGMQACEAPEGYIERAGDCDDSASEVHPEAEEVCDGSDNDCNGLTDSADPNIDLATERAYYRDADGDGYGDDSSSMTSCDQPAGYVVDDTDCNDNRAEVNPGELEVCDNLDNDCDDLFDDDDSSLDPASAETYYADADGDGYGTGAGILACNQPFQHAAQAGDCDDSESAKHPGALEVCDGLDNDCDGGSDGTAAAPNQCTAYPGVFTGSYAIRAQEKLGSTIINDMPCNGSASITIDLGATPAVQGTTSCARSGGLILFDANQSGTISADIDLEGNISGTLVHEYNDDLVRSYSFSASLIGDDLDISGTGSLLPHPMSAVPWQVTYSLDTER